MGASPGGFRAVRSQLALRQVFVVTKSPVLLEPEVHVSAARESFDAERNLTDDQTRENVRALVAALVGWALPGPAGAGAVHPAPRIPWSLAAGRPATVTVNPGRWTAVSIAYDTGLR
jgi:hypothetical protein